jgi:uncharacterized protein (TIGR03437 family)
MAIIFLMLVFVFSLQGQGDIRLRPDSAFSGLTPTILWTNGLVPYVIDPDIPSPSRFTDAVAYYNSSTPLHFQPRGSEANYVHLVRSTVGNGICSSSVGMIGGEQFLHVEDACTTATLIHEMGHAVGFFHEQSRQDRNLHVTILYENINKTGYSDFSLNSPPIEQDVGIYDYASHMHYTPFEFSANNLPVMQTVPAGIPLDSYSVLSPGDLDTLFRMYGKAPTMTTLVTNPPGLQMTIDGQTVSSPQVLNWAAGSTHTVNSAGQTPGNLRYVFARWSDGGNVTHTITADPAATFYSLDFTQLAPLSVGVTASGGGTASLDVATPDGYAPSQTVFTMTATPAPGYTFQHWSGGTSCPRANAGSPSTFVLGSTAISCVATFTQSPVTTIVTDPLNLPLIVDGASFVQTPVNEVWAAGTTHTISTAAPASNPTSAVRYVFEGWSDGGAPSHTVTAGSGTATIRASYKTQYNLVLPSFSPSVATITVSPSSPDGFYDAGTNLQVTATPGPGFKFFQWTRDLAGQPNPATLTMDSQKLFGASFFQNPSALAIANSASLANTAVAPGEIVTIFRSPAGTNPIGPDNFVVGQPDASGKFGTSLADTLVTFNGVPAPILYASAGQTSVVAPYGLQAGQLLSGVAVQVQFNGKTTSGSATMNVSAPGLFTAATNGVGQVLAANQDGTLNSAANPARRGSIVTFYGTGAGQLSPGGVDGAIIGLPLPVLTQPVSVRIGGKPAQLPYAGPAPFEVSGVLQVNAMVPLDAPSGDDSVYLVIGLNSSPMGVSVAVQ